MCVKGHDMGGVMCVKGHDMGGVMFSWVMTWVGSCMGSPTDNGATRSGKGSICSKLFVRQGFCGSPGRVNFRVPKNTPKFCLHLNLRVQAKHCRKSTMSKNYLKAQLT